MSNIVARTYEPRDEQGMNEVIQKSFNNPNSNAYPLPPARFVVIAELDGKVVGHTSIRPMLFHAGGKIIRAGILHMVGTDPANQHKGIGHAMMDKVGEIARHEQLVISLLETPVPRFYALKGWEVISDRVEISVPRAAIDARVKSATGTVEIRDGSLDRLSRYVALRERMASKCWFFVHANEAYMNLLIEKACHGSLVEFFHEIWQDGKLKGYVLGNRDASVKAGEVLKIAIRELVLEEYHPALVACIFKELLGFDDEFQAVTAGHHVVPALAATMKELGGSTTIAGGNVDMVRITMVKEFFEQASDQVDAGLHAFLQREKQAKGADIELDVDGELVLLSCSSGHLAIRAGKDSGSERGGRENAFSVSRNDLARLVVGLVSPSMLVQEGKARCNPTRALRQLDAMFPARPVVINYSNSFFQAHLKEMHIEP